MKIFVAYGYNDRDRWVEDLVFPIIRAFGAEVIIGDELQGERLTKAVEEKIKSSDGLVAFLTKRKQFSDGKWGTHRWVTDELAHALQCQIRVVEVREHDVDDQGGIAGDRQFIEYYENARDKCLVELVKTIGRWHLSTSVTLQLLPEEFTSEVRRFLKRPGFRCSYKVLDGDHELGTFNAEILPIKGGLFIKARDLPRKALIQIHVEAEGRTWTSDFEPIDSLSIHLRKD